MQAKVSKIAKLTPPQVRKIRQRYRRGDTQVALARGHGVSQATISKLVRGLIYQHV